MPLKRKIAGITLGVVFLVTRVAFSQSTNLYTFSGDVDLGYYIFYHGSSGGHCIGARGDTVYVVWADWSTYCQKSIDGGRSFGLPVAVNSTYSGVNPSMKLDTTGIIYVAYDDFADIYFTKSTDGGQTFVPAVKVNDDTIPQTGQERPAIAVNHRGQIFIAWGDQRNRPPAYPTLRQVFIATSFDSGASFGSNVQVSDSSTPLVGEIDIDADDSGRVYVVWEPFLNTNKRPILLARSDDSGLTFPTRGIVTDLPPDTSTAGGFFPSIACEGEAVGVAWKDRRFEQYALRFSVSTDYGQSFSPSTVIDDSAEPQFPSLVFKNGVFYVTWRGYYFLPSDSSWEDQVYFSYSPDTGQSFVPRADVVQGAPVFARQSGGCLTVNEFGKAFVVWADYRYDIYGTDDPPHLFASAGVSNVVKGDLNMDGLITLFDVVSELNAVFFGQPFPANFAAADINCDLRLTPTDMVLLLRMYYLSEYFAC